MSREKFIPQFADEIRAQIYIIAERDNYELINPNFDKLFRQAFDELTDGMWDDVGEEVYNMLQPILGKPEHPDELSDNPSFASLKNVQEGIEFLLQTGLDDEAKQLLLRGLNKEMQIALKTLNTNQQEGSKLDFHGMTKQFADEMQQLMDYVEMNKFVDANVFIRGAFAEFKRQQ